MYTVLIVLFCLMLTAVTSTELLDSKHTASRRLLSADDDAHTTSGVGVATSIDIPTEFPTVFGVDNPTSSPTMNDTHHHHHHGGGGCGCGCNNNNNNNWDGGGSCNNNWGNGCGCGCCCCCNNNPGNAPTIMPTRRPTMGSSHRNYRN